MKTKLLAWKESYKALGGVAFLLHIEETRGWWFWRRTINYKVKLVDGIWRGYPEGYIASARVSACCERHVCQIGYDLVNDRRVEDSAYWSEGSEK